ncbi:hypothetical protein DVK07_19650 [Halorubrum sp. Atlit-26R]|nr:hypothetical protein DVK07_19650 [Halorubrum sp. Atlit-26R]
MRGSRPAPRSARHPFRRLFRRPFRRRCRHRPVPRRRTRPSRCPSLPRRSSRSVRPRSSRPRRRSS